MKYRYLTYQELDLLQEDFSFFLYKEGVSNYEYKLLQDQYSTTALKLLGKYSDQMFDKLLQEVDFLEFRNNKQLRSFKFYPTHYTTIGIEVPASSSLDLTDIDTLWRVKAKELGGYRCFKKDSFYPQNREHEIFKYIEAGAYVVDGRIFQHLDLLRQSYEN